MDEEETKIQLSKDPEEDDDLRFEEYVNDLDLDD
jgi:hypothetical protein